MCPLLQVCVFSSFVSAHKSDLPNPLGFVSTRLYCSFFCFY